MFLVMLMLALATPQATQSSLELVQPKPLVVSVDPKSVRSGGDFVVQIDVQDSTPPIDVLVFREDFSTDTKLTLTSLTDNGPNDLAPQKGLIKCRIKTDDTWLSNLGGSRTPQTDKAVRYRIVLSTTIMKPRVPGSGFARGSTPLLWSVQVEGGFVRVFSSPELVNNEAVIGADVDMLLKSAVNMRLSANATAAVWKMYDGTQPQDAALMGRIDYSREQLSMLGLSEHASSLYKSRSPETGNLYVLLNDPAIGALWADACPPPTATSTSWTACDFKGKTAPSESTLSRADQLDAALKQLKAGLTADQQTRYAPKLAEIEKQVKAIHEGLRPVIK